MRLNLGDPPYWINKEWKPILGRLAKDQREHASFL